MKTVKIYKTENRPEQIIKMSNSRAARWVESAQAEYYEGSSVKTPDHHPASQRD